MSVEVNQVQHTIVIELVRSNLTPTPLISIRLRRLKMILSIILKPPQLIPISRRIRTSTMKSIFWMSLPMLLLDLWEVTWDTLKLKWIQLTAILSILDGCRWSQSRRRQSLFTRCCRYIYVAHIVSGAESRRRNIYHVYDDTVERRGAQHTQRFGRKASHQDPSLVDRWNARQSAGRGSGQTSAHQSPFQIDLNYSN